LTEAT